MSTEITPESLQTEVEMRDNNDGLLNIRTLGWCALTERQVLDLIVVLLEWTSENMRRKLSGNSAGTTTKGQE